MKPKIKDNAVGKTRLKPLRRAFGNSPKEVPDPKDTVKKTFESQEGPMIPGVPIERQPEPNPISEDIAMKPRPATSAAPSLPGAPTQDTDVGDFEDAAKRVSHAGPLCTALSTEEDKAAKEKRSARFGAIMGQSEAWNFKFSFGKGHPAAEQFKPEPGKSYSLTGLANKGHREIGKLSLPGRQITVVLYFDMGDNSVTEIPMVDGRNEVKIMLANDKGGTKVRDVRIGHDDKPATFEDAQKFAEFVNDLHAKAHASGKLVASDVAVERTARITANSKPGVVESDFVADLNERAPDPKFHITVQQFREIWSLPMARLRRDQDVIDQQIALAYQKPWSEEKKAEVIADLQHRRDLRDQAVNYKNFEAPKDKPLVSADAEPENVGEEKMPKQSAAEKHCDSAGEWHSAAGLLRLPVAWKSSDVIEGIYLVAQSVPGSFNSAQDAQALLVDQPADIQVHYASAAGMRELAVASAYPKDALRIGGYAHYVGGRQDVLAFVASAEPLGVLSVSSEGVKCVSHRGDIYTFDRRDLVSHSLYGFASGDYAESDLDVGFADKEAIVYYGDDAYPVVGPDGDQMEVWGVDNVEAEDPAVQAYLEGGEPALVQHVASAHKWPAQWATKVVANMERGALAVRVVIPQNERRRLSPWGSAAFNRSAGGERIYAFRAEAQVDVSRLAQELPKEEVLNVDVVSGRLAGSFTVRMTLRSFTLQQLKAAMAKVVDGHVMLRTVREGDTPLLTASKAVSGADFVLVKEFRIPNPTSKPGRADAEYTARILKDVEAPNYEVQVAGPYIGYYAQHASGFIDIRDVPAVQWNNLNQESPIPNVVRDAAIKGLEAVVKADNPGVRIRRPMFHSGAQKAVSALDETPSRFDLTGKRFRVSVSLLGKDTFAQHQKKILSRMLRSGGDGRVEVVRQQGDMVEVAGWKGDAILGTLTIPKAALITASAQKAVSGMREKAEVDVQNWARSKLSPEILKGINVLQGSLYGTPGGSFADDIQDQVREALRDLGDVWYDVQSGEILTSEPQAEEIDGEWLEPDWSEIYHFPNEAVVSAVVGHELAQYV